MWNPLEFRSVAATLPLLILAVFCSSLCTAQTANLNLDSYISQSVGEAGTLYGVTINGWLEHHPGEAVETPDDIGFNDPNRAYELSPRQKNDWRLQGRWCLRSSSAVELANGVHVLRTALFYQPRVEYTYGKPLPPLPGEKGEALRNHGCKLVAIVHEFYGTSDSQALLDSIARQLPGQRSEEPGKFLLPTGEAYWKPVYSFNKIDEPDALHFLFVHDPKTSKDEDAPAVLLKWKWGTLDYGQPSAKVINPLAGQPWLEMRAAVLARLPKDATLDMLSFLAPQIGDYWEQPSFFCHKQLIPVLRKWFDLAAHSKPQEQAAALLLADRVLGHLDSCAEFSNSGELSANDQEEAQRDYDSLEKDLRSLGIKTATPTRIGNEYYAGNLMEKILKLVPKGPVNELARISILDNRCHWSGDSDSADCGKIIEEGESFLAHFSEDEWTPSVHLILAEAYGLMATNSPYEGSAKGQPGRSEWEEKAAFQYRAWYAKSANHRDRPLVWQEIWGLDAGLGPWLLMPFQKD
jgi:hypothetical protein